MASPLRNFLVTVQMQADFSAVRRETDRNRQQVGQYVRDVQGNMRQAGAAWDGTSASIRAQAQVIGTAKLNLTQGDIAKVVTPSSTCAALRTSFATIQDLPPPCTA